MLQQSIHIGGQTRTLEFTPEAIALAQQMLSGSSPRVALALHADVGVVAICAAVAFRKENEKIDPKRVLAWLKREPKKYIELETKTKLAATAYYRELGVIDGDDDEGEASGVGESLTPGSTSSKSPADTASTPASSES